MLDAAQSLVSSLFADRTLIVALGVAVGIFLVILGVFYPTPDTARIARRMLAAGGRARPSDAGSNESGLMRAGDYSPTGFMKALVPLEAKERSQVSLELAQAGFRSPTAVAKYFVIRAVFGLILPIGLASLYFLASRSGQLEQFGPTVANLEPFTVIQIAAGSILVGFYGPPRIVKMRADERRTRIRMAFPNALDLMKIGIEAGMGFDAAMTRVAGELQVAAPELSREIIDAQREILAGRDRVEAYVDMAERLGIEEARSFVALIAQSRQFGTSAAQALAVYSDEMRQRRELMAQEKANKLPVQMSAVMALLMLPTLLIVSVGPAVIRYMMFMVE